MGQYILHHTTYKDALLQKDDGSHTKTKRQIHEEGYNHESHRRRRVPEGSTNIIFKYVNVVSNSILFNLESMVKPYHRPSITYYMGRYMFRQTKSNETSQVMSCMYVVVVDDEV